MENKIRNERLEIKLTEEEKALFEICNALNMNGILETISGYAISYLQYSDASYFLFL